MTASARNTPPLAVVTGAVSGIGAALVVDLLGRGYPAWPWTWTTTGSPNWPHVSTGRQRASTC